MKRELVRTKAFERTLRRYLKRHPESGDAILEAFKLLTDDAFNPKLKTHKLSGDLAEMWACSAGYDVRILFAFDVQDKQEKILLLTIGSHDDVY